MSLPASIPPGPLRLFVAMDPDDRAREALRRWQQQLATAVPERSVRWVRAEHYHLTLVFLGNVAAESVPDLRSRLADALAGRPALDLTLGAPGAFPSLAVPRVIWVEVSGNLAALETLQQAIAAATSGLGDYREERPFSPHLTLGRVVARNLQTARAIGERLKHAPAPEPCAWRGAEVRLYQSALQPTGPVYSVLAGFPVTGAN